MRAPTHGLEELARLAVRLCSPASHLRVVDAGAAATRAYVEAGARVTAVGGFVADRPEGVHTLVGWGRDGELALLHGDADLVVWGNSIGGPEAGARLRTLARLLAPGGRLIFRSDPQLAAAAVELGLVATHSWFDGGLTAATDPRPALPWPSDLLGLDRTMCVDRARVLDAHARPAAIGPLSLRPADAPAVGRANRQLVETLRRQTASGDPDPSALPWPDVTRVDPSRDAGCDVLVLMPHPDDETVYAGGTIAGLTAGGHQVHLIVATDGGGGRGGDGLATRRARELLHAAAILGLRGLECLGWDDTGKYRDLARQIAATAGDAIRAWGLDRALAELVAAIRTHRPRVLLSLDPQVDPNYSLHGHHLALGTLAAVAFHRAADPVFVAEGLAPWAVAEHRVLGRERDANDGHAFEVDRATKRAALLAHASQAYSTQRLLQALDDEARPAIEVTRRLQAREDPQWVLVRPRGRAPCDADVDWPSEARRVRAVLRPRRALADVLGRQATVRGADRAVHDSIDLLRRADTVAVVTGQQVGLLGGPAYTLTKGLAAIALARRLSARGVPTVPVFWMATQDHDAVEVSRVPRLEGRTAQVPTGGDGGAVGHKRLGAGVEPVLDEWLAALPLAVRRRVRSLVRRTHDSTRTYSTAFAELLGELTRDTGLILLDPDDAAFAALARPVLARELLGPERASGPLRAARARLGTETIPTDRDLLQVFFADDRGRRHRLRPTADGVAFGDTRLRRAEVEALLEVTPERFSPAALLRPVVQNAVLPAIAYVAGPTEVRYLEQTLELHAWAGTPAARVVARPTVDPIGAEDAAALQPFGGPNALRAHPRPYDALGRAGLSTAERAWLHDLEDVVVRLRRQPAPPAALWTRIATLAEEAPKVLASPRLRRTWQGEHGIGAQVAALGGDRERPRGGRVAHLLRRMIAVMLRDGRRRARGLVAAYERVTAAPQPCERRMTTAELVARYGARAPAAVLAALENTLPRVVELRAGEAR